MNQSENINELAAALAKAQGEMQAAIKDCINPFFKSKYADLGSVWDAARPVLCKNGLCIMQTTEMLGEKIVMVTMLAHTSGQWVKSYLPLNPSKNDSQGVGAAITYLRRYSLSALVGVVCDDDDDGETASGRGKTSPPQKQATKETQVTNDKIETAEVIAISNLADKLDGESFKSFMGWIKVTFDAMSISDIPKNAVERCLNLINAKIKLVNDQNRVVA